MAKSDGHIKAKRQEQRITRSLNQIKEEARNALASGSKWFAKSDVISKHFRIEAKTKATPSKSFSIKREWLDKIGAEAFETGKIPVLAFSFGDNKDYFVLEDRHFYELVEEFVRGRGK